MLSFYKSFIHSSFSLKKSFFILLSLPLLSSKAMKLSLSSKENYFFPHGFSEKKSQQTPQFHKKDLKSFHNISKDSKDIYISQDLQNKEESGELFIDLGEESESISSSHLFKIPAEPKINQPLVLKEKNYNLFNFHFSTHRPPVEEAVERKIQEKSFLQRHIETNMIYSPLDYSKSFSHGQKIHKLEEKKLLKKMSLEEEDLKKSTKKSLKTHPFSSKSTRKSSPHPGKSSLNSLRHLLGCPLTIPSKAQHPQEKHYLKKLPKNIQDDDFFQIYAQDLHEKDNRSCLSKKKLAFLRHKESNLQKDSRESPLHLQIINKKKIEKSPQGIEVFGHFNNNEVQKLPTIPQDKNIDISKNPKEKNIFRSFSSCIIGANPYHQPFASCSKNFLSQNNERNKNNEQHSNQENSYELNPFTHFVDYNDYEKNDYEKEEENNLPCFQKKSPQSKQGSLFRRFSSCVINAQKNQQPFPFFMKK